MPYVAHFQLQNYGISLTFAFPYFIPYFKLNHTKLAPAHSAQGALASMRIMF